MTDLDRFFADPNGPAYRKDEQRNGPPLSYVAEKQRYALEELHAAHRTLGRPGRESEASPANGSVEPPPAGELNQQVRQAFAYQATAFLALHNMLGATGAARFQERLLGMDRPEFERWLDFIEREGSVSGA